MEHLIPAVEAILFTADHPVSLARIQQVFGENPPTEDEIANLIQAIRQKYSENTFGFELREAQGGFHFVTKLENADYVRRFMATKPFRLGRSALETLAIIAYRQPVTRAEIDKVRGIDSSHLMRTLMERGLVKMAGKAEVPGRPVQYATTPRFLEVLGLNSMSDLPPLTELDQLQGNTEDPMKALEEGLDKFIADKVEQHEDTEEADTAGLQAIESLIDSVQKADEVYASAEHAEVAKENQAALQAFLAFMKPYRKSKNTPASGSSDGSNEGEKGATTDEETSATVSDLPHVTEAQADSLFDRTSSELTH